MVFAILVLSLVLLALSVHLIRTPSSTRLAGVSALLTGLVVALIGCAVLVVVTVGRGPWNSWVAGTPHRETVTLSVILLGLPAALVSAGLCLVVGGLNSRRRRRTGGTRPT
jgi:hypothetical protein